MLARHIIASIDIQRRLRNIWAAGMSLNPSFVSGRHYARRIRWCEAIDPRHCPECAREGAAC